MSETLLGLAALGLAAAALAHYATTVIAVQVAKRPRAHQAAVAFAMALAALAIGSGAGWLGGLAAWTVLGVGATFLFLTTASALPSVQPAVSVGALAPDFGASDSEGQHFRLSEQRGRRILLKFFRGHW